MQIFCMPPKFYVYVLSNLWWKSLKVVQGLETSLGEGPWLFFFYLLCCQYLSGLYSCDYLNKYMMNEWVNVCVSRVLALWVVSTTGEPEPVYVGIPWPPGHCCHLQLTCVASRNVTQLTFGERERERSSGLYTCFIHFCSTSILRFWFCLKRVTVALLPFYKVLPQAFVSQWSYCKNKHLIVFFQ